MIEYFVNLFSDGNEFLFLIQIFCHNRDYTKHKLNVVDLLLQVCTIIVSSSMEHLLAILIFFTRIDPSLEA